MLNYLIAREKYIISIYSPYSLGGHNDAPAIETQYALYGSSLEMNCVPSIDPPVKFHWEKLEGRLPEDAQTFEV